MMLYPQEQARTPLGGLRLSRGDPAWLRSDFDSLPNSQHHITPTTDLAYPVKKMNTSISKAVKYEV